MFSMAFNRTPALFRKIHLYIGLWLGLIFVMMGLTGGVLAWLPELDRAFNPDLLRASVTDIRKSSPVDIAQVESVLNLLITHSAYDKPVQLTLPEDAEGVYIASYPQPRTERALWFSQEITRQVMVDPYALRITGEREWGRFGLSPRLLMPSIFHLHRYILAGEIGKTVIGISGLLLLATTITGFVLWLPRLNRKAIMRALCISHQGSWPRFNYSLHRTAGFFAAPVLATMAFSGWYFNLPNWVTPIVGTVMAMSPTDKLSNHAATDKLSPISLATAMQAAQKLYPDARFSRIRLPVKPTDPYEIRMHQPGEVHQNGATRITIDAYSAEILRIHDPLQGPAGDRFLAWQFPLHTGEAFGTAGRAFISIFGLAPILFAVTGLSIWLKRRKRIAGRADDF